MNLVELLQIASSEEKAEEFLREKGILKTFDSCPFCNAKKKLAKLEETSTNAINVKKNGVLEKTVSLKI
jgi:transposase